MQTQPQNNTVWLQLVIIFITAVVSFIVGIFFTPIKKWISSEHDEYCAFTAWGDAFRGSHQIKVKKRFNRTVYVNCSLYTRREKKEHNGVNYLWCYYGMKPPKSMYNFNGGYCRFDNITQKKFEKQNST